jgi:hypothetical protein
MKIDDRIQDRKYIFDCFSADKAKEYIGENCYMTDDLPLFEDLDFISVRKLDAIDNSGFYYEEVDSTFEYCLPVRFVKPVEKKEKKYRPYTLEEFLNEGFEIIVFREKDCPSREFHLRYNGYRKCDNVYKVILGNMSYTLSDLFEDFERFYNGRWFPFGVKEE